MLKNKNLFFSAFLAANIMFVSNVFADNPGEIVAQADDAAEEVLEETAPGAPSATAES